MRSRSRSRSPPRRRRHHHDDNNSHRSWFEERKSQRDSIPLPGKVWSRSPSPPLNYIPQDNKLAVTQTKIQELQKQMKKNEKKEKKKKERKKTQAKSEPDESNLLMQSTPVVADEQLLGPQRMTQLQVDDASFGAKENMMKDEGESYAQFVKENKRIPRRGEIGLTSDEIESFEGAGYVMSGSRHRFMNAVRIRKESAVYNAEEQRALAQFNYEEKEKREHKILSELQDLVAEKVRKAELETEENEEDPENLENAEANKSINPLDLKKEDTVFCIDEDGEEWIENTNDTNKKKRKREKKKHKKNKKSSKKTKKKEKKHSSKKRKISKEYLT